MPNSGRDPDAHSLPERNQLVVELHFRVGAAFENEIGLGQPLVVMQFGVRFDLRDVNCRRVIGNFGERSLCDAARARSSRQLCKVDELPSWLYGIAHGSGSGCLRNCAGRGRGPCIDNRNSRREPYSQQSQENSQPNLVLTPGHFRAGEYSGQSATRITKPSTTENERPD
jgi:hypothetical protein